MTTLLLPGTSKTALAAATHLHATSPRTPYLLGTRTPSTSATHTDPLTHLTHPTLTLSYADPTTWASAFATASPPISTLYLVPPPGLPTFVADSKTFLSFAAREAGVKRIVWLSASLVPKGGPAHGEVHAFLHELAASVNGAGGELRYAVLRPTWFAQNFTDRAHFHNVSVRAPSEADGGVSKVWSASAPGKVPWVSVADIGAVAFHALTAPDGVSKDGKEYLILGPQLASYDDVANLLGEVLGREVTHVKVSVEQLAERFAGLGVPREYANVLAGMDALIARGDEERLGGCVREVTGREPVGLREVFEEARRNGAWD